MQTKDQLRQAIWTLLQQKKVARFPGAEGRIPNFIGAEACAKLLAETPYWKAAKVLKCNPDSPQRAIRQRALAEGKIAYMAVPRLRSDKPFIELDPAKLKCSPYAASSIKGASQHGRLGYAAGCNTIRRIWADPTAPNITVAAVARFGAENHVR